MKTEAVASLIVQKYGGSSVKNKRCINMVADKIVQYYKLGYQLVIVLSAQGDTTDQLIKKAQDLTSNPSLRELDMLLATGEQQSVALMAQALIQRHCPSVSLNAFQAGIQSDSVYGHAQIEKIDGSRIINELNNHKIVLITGFQAVNAFLDITTLGRGGSDTSAVALAGELKASRCEIYSDVAGVYSGDPKIIKNPWKHSYLDYDTMLELASLGANVLHNRAVSLARKYQMPLHIKSSFNTEGGTIIMNQPIEKTLISGVVVDKEMGTIAILGLNDQPGVAYQIFSLLADQHIPIDIILQAVGQNRKKDMVFTTNQGYLKQALALLQQAPLPSNRIEVNEDVAKLSVVGTGLESNPQIGALVFKTLHQANINIDMIATSEIKLSLIIDRKQADLAANLLHDALLEYIKQPSV